MKVNLKRYGLYLLRWQASTPLLAVVMWLIGGWGVALATVVANAIGGLIFFWVDQYIFTSDKLAEQWEVKENIACVDCGKVSRGYRLVKMRNYDKTDATPEFRCEVCSSEKYRKMVG
jgi:hypothetical protein